MGKREEIMDKKELVSEVTQHLKTKIIPFWEGLRDDEFGGYYGYMDYDLKVDKEAVKGCILNSRILWFFSRAYNELGEGQLLGEAEHAYEFMKDYCFDAENGGIYWSITYDGKSEDTTKHTYNQAFSIYALAEYYEASGNAEALKLAMDQFDLIETKMKDSIGYKEALDVKFRPVSNDKLSENGVIADRTMNTLLHVFEAYTNLYRVLKNAGKTSEAGRVGTQLTWIFREFAGKVWNPKLRRQEVFFDNDFNSLIDLYSYGHDIETSWLMDYGLGVLGDPEISALIAPITDAMADNLIKVAYDGHSLPAECEKGVVKENRVWWVQAETYLGFLNASLKHPEREDYRNAVYSTWNFIKEYVVDKREESEWFWEVRKDGSPYEGEPIVEPWKCPYHNGRMCLETIRRLK